MRARVCAVAVFVLITGFVLIQSRADDVRAVITLGTDPEPPTCVGNPGGTVQVFWEIQHQTTPDSVTYELRSPSLDLLEQEVYLGSTGLTVAREWIVPSGSVQGAYWVRVSYYSVEVGNEANAEVVFLVCEPTVPIRDTSWGRIRSFFLP